MLKEFLIMSKISEDTRWLMFWSVVAPISVAQTPFIPALVEKIQCTISKLCAIWKRHLA